MVKFCKKKELIKMKFPKHYGKCRICGEEKQLTYEHVPPEKAYNSNTIVEYSFEQVINMIGDEKRLPWDYSGIKGKYNQKASGGYYLCKDCNNNTGSWYIEEYVAFVNTIGAMIAKESFEERKYYNFTIKDLYPLRIFKAIVTMICDTNHNCLGDIRLRNFLLDKESNDFDTNKYQIYAYLVTPNSMRCTGFVVEKITNITEFVKLSEVAHFPFGFTMYIDKPKDFNAFGVNITSLVDHNYNDKGDITFEGMPYVRLNSKLPIDYRTREEFEKCIDK